MRLGSVTVWTTDPSAIRDWYVTHVGLHVAEETPRFVLLRDDEGGAIAFHVGEPLTTPERVQFHVEVDDVDATYDRLRAAGVAFDEPPTDRPWGV